MPAVWQPGSAQYTPLLILSHQFGCETLLTVLHQPPNLKQNSQKRHQETADIVRTPILMNFRFLAKMITPNAPHWPKVRMGRSGGGAAFLRKAISRIGERNVEEEWDGNTNNICGWCRVFSNRSHRSNLGGGQGWNREWWEYAGGSGQCRRGLTCKLVVSPSMPPPQHNARSTSSPSWLCRYPPSSSNDP